MPEGLSTSELGKETTEHPERSGDWHDGVIYRPPGAAPSVQLDSESSAYFAAGEKADRSEGGCVRTIVILTSVLFPGPQS